MRANGVVVVLVCAGQELEVALAENHEMVQVVVFDRLGCPKSAALDVRHDRSQTATDGAEIFQPFFPEKPGAIGAATICPPAGDERLKSVSGNHSKTGIGEFSPAINSAVASPSNPSNRAPRCVERALT